MSPKSLFTVDSPIRGGSNVRTSPVKWVVFLLMLHVPLGYAMHQSKVLATAHAVLVILYAFFRALVSSDTVEVVSLVAYVVGAEVLWRMCRAQIFWETGKYAVIAILGVYGLRFVRRRVRWPFFYVILLLPAAIPTFMDLDFSLARMYVSFNLSGPLSVAVCLWFFSGISLSRIEAEKIVCFFIAPIVGVASITMFSTYLTRNITFTTSSNFTTSGGFGPNQVAAVLAIGFVLVFFQLFLCQPKKRLLLVFLAFLLPVFLTQSAMTFSRTGPVLALGSTLFGGIFLLRNTRARIGLIIGSSVLLLAMTFFILPALNDFTSGTFEARYQETDTSNRFAIFEDEIDVWMQYPLVGAGLGMARFSRSSMFDDVASHTEFSRLLAEHGLLGLVALLLLLSHVWRNIMIVRAPLSRAMTTALSCYFIGFLLVSGMRLALPSLALGLAFTFLKVREQERESYEGGRLDA